MPSFEHIARQVRSAQRRGQPVISVDTKKKVIGRGFRNSGRDWRPKDEPVEVQVHDFMDPKLGKAIPYGVYDSDGECGVGERRNRSRHGGLCGRGRSADWWQRMGRSCYPKATELLITSRRRPGATRRDPGCGTVAIQKLADDIGLTRRVCHFPPGTSKWNKIEHLALQPHFDQLARAGP